MIINHYQYYKYTSDSGFCLILTIFVPYQCLTIMATLLLWFVDHKCMRSQWTGLLYVYCWWSELVGPSFHLRFSSRIACWSAIMDKMMSKRNSLSVSFGSVHTWD